MAVLNFDDPEVRGLADAAPARVLPFRTEGPLDHGAWLDAGCALLREPAGEATRVGLDGLPLSGAHNRENAVAALAAAWAAGADPQRAVAALASFRGLPHRMESIGRVKGVLDAVLRLNKIHQRTSVAIYEVTPQLRFDANRP